MLALQHRVLREFRLCLPSTDSMSVANSPAHAALRIRRAIPADLEALLALENASFTGDKLSRARLRHWIGAENGILLVAISSGELLGSALVFTRVDSPAARLYSIAIASSARGQGLGGSLLRRAEQDARKQGFTAMRLEVAAGNAAAIALYRKRGYVEFGRKAGYYEDGQDALRMQKSL